MLVRKMVKQMNKQAILEGLLFIVGEDGLTIEQIGDMFEMAVEEVKELIEDLKKSYEDEKRGIKINHLGNSIKLTTKPEHKEYYKKLIENNETNTLSNAALETLAIIAYNEPMARIKVDEMRGVDSSHIIRKLIAKDLIKEVGRSEAVGHPILYGITNDFLDYFNLSSKEDLPKVKELNKVINEEEKDLFLSRYNEDNE